MRTVSFLVSAFLIMGCNRKQITTTDIGHRGGVVSPINENKDIGRGGGCVVVGRHAVGVYEPPIGSCGSGGATGSGCGENHSEVENSDSNKGSGGGGQRSWVDTEKPNSDTVNCGTLGTSNATYSVVSFWYNNEKIYRYTKN